MKNLKKILLTIVIATIAIVITTFSIKRELSMRKYVRYQVDYAAQADLKYYHCLSELVDAVDEYIMMKSPTSNLTGYHLVNTCLEQNIDLIFVLSQTQQECNFGVEGLAAKTNSAWNQGAFDGDTFEEILDIYKYNHPDASLEPYIDLLKRRYLVGKVEMDLMDNFVDVDGQRYATDKDYEKKLTAIYAKIKTETKIDSLSNRLNY